MNYYFDTSALIKNYIEEIGSEIVSVILDEADDIYVSEICIIECISTVRRIYKENNITKEDYETIKKELKNDMQYFKRISIENVYSYAEDLIDKYQLKSLDSIQLGSMLLFKDQIDEFVCCDSKLNLAASEENLSVINPVEESAR